jgi:hypothetical protein
MCCSEFLLVPMSWYYIVVIWLNFLLCRGSKQVELSHPNAELRLLEVFYHKIYKVITTNSWLKLDRYGHVADLSIKFLPVMIPFYMASFCPVDDLCDVHRTLLASDICSTKFYVPIKLPFAPCRSFHTLRKSRI